MAKVFKTNRFTVKMKFKLKKKNGNQNKKFKGTFDGQFLHVI